MFTFLFLSHDVLINTELLFACPGLNSCHKERRQLLAWFADMGCSADMMEPGTCFTTWCCSTHVPHLRTVCLHIPRLVNIAMFDHNSFGAWLLPYCMCVFVASCMCDMCTLQCHFTQYTQGWKSWFCAYPCYDTACCTQWTSKLQIILCRIV